MKQVSQLIQGFVNHQIGILISALVIVFGGVNYEWIAKRVKDKTDELGLTNAEQTGPDERETKISIGQATAEISAPIRQDTESSSITERQSLADTEAESAITTREQAKAIIDDDIRTDEVTEVPIAQGVLNDADGVIELLDRPSGIIVKKLNSGTTVLVLSEGRKFVKVKTGDGTTGFVSRSRIQTKPLDL